MGSCRRRTAAAVAVAAAEANSQINYVTFPTSGRQSQETVNDKRRHLLSENYPPATTAKSEETVMAG
jgi:hypothetical protein